MSASWKFDKPMIKVLTGIDRDVKNATKRGVRRVAAEIRTEMRSRTPVLSGALKQSLASKVDTKRGTTYGIVGPRSRFAKKIKGRLMPVIPNRYAGVIDKATQFMSGIDLKPYQQKMITEVKAEIDKTLNG